MPAVASRVVLVLLLVAATSGGPESTRCRASEPALRGRAFGSTFNVRLSRPLPEPRWQALQTDIQATLDALEGRLSIWREDSEVSKLNRHRVSDPVLVSEDLEAVLRFSLRLHRETGGAFDPTLAPLARLWGFRQAGRSQPIPVPDPDAVAEALSRTGAKHLECVEDHRVRKRIADLELDLDAVSQGYAVDRVAQRIEQAGVSDYLVEIGGELRVRGRNADGVPWRIGIDLPVRSELPQRRLYAVMSMSDAAVATSGDYRIYRRDETGRIYSHLFDPRSGSPVRSPVASVTVLADSCLLADGAATALFVMGVDAGLKWVAARPGIEALFLIRDDEGRLAERASAGFLKKTSLERNLH